MLARTEERKRDETKRNEIKVEKPKMCGHRQQNKDWRLPTPNNN